jgi:hypothetical protein
MSVREKDSPELFAKVQEQNLLRQYDLLLSCIEVGFTKGIEAFDKYILWSLNAVVVAGSLPTALPAARLLPGLGVLPADVNRVVEVQQQTFASI